MKKMKSISAVFMITLLMLEIVTVSAATPTQDTCITSLKLLYPGIAPQDKIDQCLGLGKSVIIKKQTSVIKLSRVDEYLALSKKIKDSFNPPKVKIEDVVKQLGALRKVYPEFTNRISLDIADAYEKTGIANNLLIAKGIRVGVYTALSRQYEAELVKDPNNIKKRFDLASLYNNIGQPDLARQQYEKILAYSDSITSDKTTSAAERIDALTIKAKALASLGRFDDAITEYKRLAQVSEGKTASDARLNLALIKSKGTLEQKTEALGDFAVLEKLATQMGDEGLSLFAHRASRNLKLELYNYYNDRAYCNEAPIEQGSCPRDPAAESLAKKYQSQLALDKTQIDDIITTYSEGYKALNGGKVPDNIERQLESYRRQLGTIAIGNFSGLSKSEFEKVKEAYATAELAKSTSKLKEEFNADPRSKLPDRREVRKFEQEIFSKDYILADLEKQKLDILNSARYARENDLTDLLTQKEFQAFEYSSEISKRKLAITGGDEYRLDIIAQQSLDAAAKAEELKKAPQPWYVAIPYMGKYLGSNSDQINSLEDKKLALQNQWEEERVSIDTKNKDIISQRFNPASGKTESVYDTTSGQEIRQLEFYKSIAEKTRDTAVQIEMVLASGAVGKAVLGVAQTALAGSEIAGASELLTGTGRFTLEKYAAGGIVEGTIFHETHLGLSLVTQNKKFVDVTWADLNPADTVATFWVLGAVGSVEGKLSENVPFLTNTVEGATLNTLVVSPVAQAVALTAGSIIPEITIQVAAGDFNAYATRELAEKTLNDNLIFTMSMGALHFGDVVSNVKQKEYYQEASDRIDQHKQNINDLLSEAYKTAENKFNSDSSGRLEIETADVIKEAQKRALVEQEAILVEQRAINDRLYSDGVLPDARKKIDDAKLDFQEKDLKNKEVQLEADPNSVVDSQESIDSRKVMIDAAKNYAAEVERQKFKLSINNQMPPELILEVKKIGTDLIPQAELQVAFDESQLKQYNLLRLALAKESSPSSSLITKIKEAFRVPLSSEEILSGATADLSKNDFSSAAEAARLVAEKSSPGSKLEQYSRLIIAESLSKEGDSLLEKGELQTGRNKHEDAIMQYNLVRQGILAEDINLKNSIESHLVISNEKIAASKRVEERNNFVTKKLTDPAFFNEISHFSKLNNDAIDKSFISKDPIELKNLAKESRANLGELKQALLRQINSLAEDFTPEQKVLAEILSNNKDYLEVAKAFTEMGVNQQQFENFRDKSLKVSVESEEVLLSRIDAETLMLEGRLLTSPLKEEIESRLKTLSDLRHDIKNSLASVVSKEFSSLFFEKAKGSKDSASNDANLKGLNKEGKVGELLSVQRFTGEKIQAELFDKISVGPEGNFGLLFKDVFYGRLDRYSKVVSIKLPTGEIKSVIARGGLSHIEMLAYLVRTSPEKLSAYMSNKELSGYILRTNQIPDILLTNIASYEMFYNAFNGKLSITMASSTVTDVQLSKKVELDVDDFNNDLLGRFTPGNTLISPLKVIYPDSLRKKPAVFDEKGSTIFFTEGIARIFDLSGEIFKVKDFINQKFKSPNDDVTPRDIKIPQDIIQAPQYKFGYSLNVNKNQQFIPLADSIVEKLLPNHGTDIENALRILREEEISSYAKRGEKEIKSHIFRGLENKVFLSLGGPFELFFGSTGKKIAREDLVLFVFNKDILSRGDLLATPFDTDYYLDATEVSANSLSGDQINEYYKINLRNRGILKKTWRYNNRDYTDFPEATVNSEIVLDGDRYGNQKLVAILVNSDQYNQINIDPTIPQRYKNLLINVQEKYGLTTAIDGYYSYTGLSTLVDRPFVELVRK